jgi:hypothetical protein
MPLIAALSRSACAIFVSSGVHLAGAQAISLP